MRNIFFFTFCLIILSCSPKATKLDPALKENRILLSRWECLCEWDSDKNGNRSEFTIFMYSNNTHEFHFYKDKRSLKFETNERGFTVPKIESKFEYTVADGMWEMEPDSTFFFNFLEAKTVYKCKIEGDRISGKMINTGQAFYNNGKKTMGSMLGVRYIEE